MTEWVLHVFEDIFYQARCTRLRWMPLCIRWNVRGMSLSEILERCEERVVEDAKSLLDYIDGTK